jgi:hypothetical protein
MTSFDRMLKAAVRRKFDMIAAWSSLDTGVSVRKTVIESPQPSVVDLKAPAFSLRGFLFSEARRCNLPAALPQTSNPGKIFFKCELPHTRRSRPELFWA